MATLTYTGSASTGTAIEDVTGQDSPNSGRAKINNNIRRLMDGHNDHETMLAGLDGGIADLNTAQSFNNKVIASNRGGNGSNTLTIGRRDINDTYLTYTNTFPGITLGEQTTLSVTKDQYQINISG